MSNEFEARIEGLLELDKVDEQLKSIQNKKIFLDVELRKDAASQISKNINKSMSGIKIDATNISQQLAKAFNISDKGIVKKIQSQLNSMLGSLANTWDGKSLDFGNASGFYDGIEGLATTVTEGARVIQDKMGIYQQFYDFFKNKKLHISDSLKGELGDVYDEIRKNNPGKLVRDSLKGISVDSAYKELSAMFPEHFADNVTSQADQIIRIFDVLKAARQDLDKVMDFSSLEPGQQMEMKAAVYDEIISSMSKMADNLRKNLNDLTLANKTTFDLEIKIDEQNIKSQIEKAIRSAVDMANEPIDIRLNIDEQDVISSFRRAIELIGGNTGEPVEVNIQLNKATLLNDLEQALSNTEIPISFNIDAQQLESDIRKAIEKITDIEIDLRVNTDSVKKQVSKTVDSIDNGNAQELNNLLGNINSHGTKGQSVFQRFGISLREAFSYYTMANLLEEGIQRVVSAGKEAVDIVKTYDSYNKDLQMASGQSKSSVDGLLESYNDLAQDLGALSETVIQSSDNFIRQGRTIKETNQLIEDSLVLSAISGADGETSAEILTATLNGFQMVAEEASHVNDVISSIDLNSAASAEGIGKALTKTASVANNAGVSLEKTAAIISTIKDVTQDSDEAVGTAVKSLLSRMNQIRAGKFVDEETGEALNDVEKVLNKLNISMRDTNGQFKDSEIIIDDVASKWKTFDKNTQKAVATAMAGTYQYNKMIALFDNYGKTLELTEIAQNSQDVAITKFENSYINSLEAKTNALKSAVDSLVTTTIPDELIGGVLDTLKGMTNLTEQTGLLKGSLVGLGVSGGLFGIQKMASWIKSAAQELSNFDAAMKLVNSGNIGDDQMKTLMNLTSGLSKSQTKLLLSTNALNDSQRVAILMNQGMSQAEAQATVASYGLAGGTAAASGSVITLSGSLRALWMTMVSNPLILVAAGITALVSGITAYKNSVKESVSAARESATVFEETNNSISDNISKIQELRSALESGTLTEEASKQAKEELLSIQSQLTDSYGNQCEGIDLVNGSLEEQIALLQQLSKEEANQYLTENKRGIDEAEKQMSKQRNYNLGTFGSVNFAQMDNADEFKKIIAKYEDMGVKLSPSGEGFYTELVFKGTAEEAKEVLNNLGTDLRAFTDKYGENKIVDNVQNNISKRLEKANEVLDEYRSIYEQAQNARLISDTKVYGENGKEAAQWMNDYAEAVEKYNDALASGDTSQIKNAKKQFDAVDSSIQGLLNDQNGLGRYSNIFSDIKSQVTTATGSVNEFGDSLSSVSSQASTVKSDIESIIADSNSMFSKAQSAMDSANKGATYDSMLEMVETAEKLKKAGDMGTDDFKSIAAMFSPSGADDVENFTENLSKIKRYFTDDNDGLLNFLNDLKDKGFAELNKETQEWVYEIEDLEDAARKMGLGFEPFMAIFGKLSDKNFVNNFFNSTSEGLDVLTGLYKDLGTAQMELEDLYANDPNNTSAIKAKEEEVKSLQKQIENTTISLEKLFQKNATDYMEEDKAVRAGLTAQIEEFNKHLDKMSTEVQNRMLAEIQTTGSQYGYNSIGIVDGKLVLDTTEAKAAVDELVNTELDSKTLELNCNDEATGCIKLWNQLQANPKFAELKTDDQAIYLVHLWNSLELAEKEAVINEDEKALTWLEKFEKFKIDDKEFDVEVDDNATTVLDEIIDQLNKIKNKEVTVTTHYRDDGIKVKNGTITRADGSFHAHAQGTDVSIREKQTALINEVGNEGIVRNGILHEISGGARLVNLEPGDIIFNHKQMAELKKNGYVTSGGGRGKLVGRGSFADGTMQAFAGGGGGKLTGTGSSGSSKSSSSKSSSSSSKEETSELFDWIKNRIKKFQDSFDKWITRAEQAITKGFIESYYKRAAKQLSNLMNTQAQAYDYYLSKANGVNLSDAYKKKVREGSIAIQEITNEATREVIDQYTEYWEKATESLQAFEEAADEFYNIPLESATEKIELFSDAIDVLEEKIDNAISAEDKNNLIDQKTKQQAEILSASNVAKVTAEKNLEEAKKHLNTSAMLKGISTENKEEVQNRIAKGNQVNLDLFTEGSDSWKAAVRYNEALQASTDATNEYNKTLQETIAWEREAAKEKFDNIAEEYDRKIEMLDHGTSSLDNKISEIEARGQAVSIDYYKEQLELEEQKKAILQEEQKALEKQLETIPKGTDEWHDAYDALQDVADEISECTQNTYELNDAINEATFALHDNIHDEIDRLMDEQDFLREMMSHEKRVDENGNFTEAGYANLASLTASLEASKKNAEHSKHMVDRLDKMIESGTLSDGDLSFNSFEELEEKREQYYDEYRDDIKTTYDLEQQIYDAEAERLNAQLDAANDLIDAKKEALNQERKICEYQKEIEQKTKNVAKISKMISAYQNDSSEEGRAKLQRLQVELEEAESDLEETEMDRYFEDSEALLNSLAQEYEELIQTKLDDFQSCVQDGIDVANDNSAIANDYLSGLQESIGYESESGSLISSTETISSQVSTVIGQLIAIEQSISSLNSVGDADTSEITTAPEVTTPGNTTADLSQATQDTVKKDADKVTATPGASTSSSTAGSSGSSSSSSSSSIKKPQVSAVTRTLKNGSQGDDVGLLQKALNMIQNAGLKEDKIFGDKTEAQVKKFQKNEKIDADGIVGKKTKKKFKAKGYRKGIRKVPYEQEAWLHDGPGENQELYYRAVDGAIYTRLGAGDTVFRNEHVQRLWEIASNPSAFQLADAVPVNIPDLSELSGANMASQASSMMNHNTAMNGDVNLYITMNGVNDPKEFERQLEKNLLNNNNIRKIIQTDTVGRLAGAGQLASRTYAKYK